MGEYMQLERTYASKPTSKGGNVLGEESVLEQIAASSTRMKESTGEEYNIDNCICPSCACLPYTSPAGVATAFTARMATSPIG